MVKNLFQLFRSGDVKCLAVRRLLLYLWHWPVAELLYLFYLFSIDTFFT